MAAYWLRKSTAHTAMLLRYCRLFPIWVWLFLKKEGELRWYNWPRKEEKLLMQLRIYKSLFVNSTSPWITFFGKWNGVICPSKHFLNPFLSYSKWFCNASWNQKTGGKNILEKTIWNFPFQNMISAFWMRQKQKF